MSTEEIVSQPTPEHNPLSAHERRPQPRTPAEVHEMTCPECGSPTVSAWLHVGGRGKYPHLVCPNVAGCDTYIVCRVDPFVYNEYLDWLARIEAAAALYMDRLEATLEQKTNRQYVGRLEDATKEAGNV